MAEALKLYLGTKLKFVLNVKVDGTAVTHSNIGNYDLRVEFRNGNRVVTLASSDLLVGANSELVAPLDTTMLGAGKVTMVTYVKIADSDFADGYRVEVDRQDVLFIRNV